MIRVTCSLNQMSCVMCLYVCVCVIIMLMRCVTTEPLKRESERERNPCHCLDAWKKLYPFFILYRGIKLSIPLSISLCFSLEKKSCVLFIRGDGASQVGGEADILIRSFTATLQRAPCFCFMFCCLRDLKLANFPFSSWKH